MRFGMWRLRKSSPMEAGGRTMSETGRGADRLYQHLRALTSSGVTESDAHTPNHNEAASSDPETGTIPEEVMGPDVREAVLRWTFLNDG